MVDLLIRIRRSRSSGRGRPGSDRRGSDAGVVTLEIAVLLPVLFALTAFAMSAVGAVGAQTRCQDAAREAARAVARSEPESVARALAARAAPPGSTVGISTAGDQVTVTVSARVPLLGGVLPEVDVDASAVALLEPEAGDG